MPLRICSLEEGGGEDVATGESGDRALVAVAFGAVGVVSPAAMRERISMEQLVDVVAEFDDAGGASFGLVAWELAVDEARVRDAWDQAKAQELLKRARRDATNGEQLWRLTPGGWATGRHA